VDIWATALGDEHGPAVRFSGRSVRRARISLPAETVACCRRRLGSVNQDGALVEVDGVPGEVAEFAGA